MIFTFLFTAALLLDFLFGDPRSIPHPVRGIGLLCEFYEKSFRNVMQRPFLEGLFSFCSVLGTTVFVVAALLAILLQTAPLIATLVAVYLIYSGIAYRDLKKHSMEVYRALISQNGLGSARVAIQQIVGRDTSQLDEKGICRACVETVAENLVDGVLSPLFFGILFSLIPADPFLNPISMAALGIYFYKAINTMDSMYGYKNDRYRQFGTVAAVVDDVANFLPARLSGIVLTGAAFFLQLDYRRGWRVFKHDRLSHASPNGGHPEAAVAGILGVQLGGNSVYFGKTVHKPTIGQPVRDITPEDIVETNRLMLGSSLLFFIGIITIRLLITGF